MEKLLVEDRLCKRVEPLLPAPKPRRFRYPGRKPLDNRQALTGILFVIKTGLAWNDLPQEMGGGSGVARWGRLDEYKRQHFGRESMDRWMLHKTFLDDEVEDAPSPRDEEAL